MSASKKEELKSLQKKLRGKKTVVSSRKRVDKNKEQETEIKTKGK